MYELIHELYPYVALFFLLDSFVLLRPSEYALVRWLGGSFRWLRPGLHPAGLLPTAELLALDDPPAFATIPGLFVPRVHGLSLPPVPGPADVELVAWERLEDCRAEQRCVVAGGRTLVRTGSPASARLLAGRLRALRHASPEGRPAALDGESAARTDTAAIDAALAAWRSETRTLRVLSVVLFSIGFGLLPACLFVEWKGRPDPVLVAALLAALAGVTIIIALRALRRAGLARGEALSVLAPALFFPPAAAHVLSFLGRDLMAGFDPLAVAARLLPPERLAPVARRELALAAEGRARSGGTALAAYWIRREAAAHSVLGRVGTSAEQVFAAEASQDASAAAYCAICSIEYRRGFTTCSECSSALRAYSRD